MIVRPCPECGREDAGCGCEEYRYCRECEDISPKDDMFYGRCAECDMERRLSDLGYM